MTPSPLHEGSEAFTLAEILLALGLFAVAAAGLLALFPAAHLTERESEEETRATLIAAGIMESLPLAQFGLGSNPASCRVACGMSNGVPLWEEVNPAATQTIAVAYDACGEPLAKLSPAAALEPQRDPRTLCVATLSLQPKGSTPGLGVAEVSVAFPAAAPAPQRTLRRFVRLLALPR